MAFSIFRKDSENCITTTLSALATGQTEMFAIAESGQSALRFLPTKAMVKLVSITGTLVTPPVISIGTTASAYADLMQALTLTGLNTAHNALPFVLPSSLASINIASNSIKANVSVAAAGTGLTNYTLKLYLFGFFE